ncbi:MAG: DAK2 domain-containing protein [Carboxydocellales bacterium]
MKLERLRGIELKNLFLAANQLLTAKKDEVDALNVFPVPDGDTGTNMALTLQAAVARIQQTSEDSVAKVAEAAAQGSLMGARGNSGVILSQLLRGFSLVLADKQEIGPRELAQALQSGVDTAYLGVKKPVEGTILTVARLAAKEAVQTAKAASTTVEVMEAAYSAAQQALADTPNLLPILKQVGVVDAGGMGWLLILQAFLQVISGEDMLQAVPSAEKLTPSTEAVKLGSDTLIANYIPADLSQIEYQYCTELIIKGQHLNSTNLNSELEPWGDSLLVVGDSSLLKVHIHTNHPGRVLEACVVLGSLHEIHINNMLEQSQNRPGKLKPLGLVAVASGEGLKKVLLSLGVDEVVQGGQTSNPSTEDLIKSINSVAAEAVILLPNNGNIILAAQQAREIINKQENSKQVEIVPSKNIAQGIAAIIAFDPALKADPNLERMNSALTQVVSVEITYAVRDSRWEEINILEGDILGLVDDKIKVVGQSVPAVVEQVLNEVLTPKREIVTLFYGENVSAQEAEALLEVLENKYPQVEFEAQEGGQPLYFYLISVD